MNVRLVGGPRGGDVLAADPTAPYINVHAPNPDGPGQLVHQYLRLRLTDDDGRQIYASGASAGVSARVPQTATVSSEAERMLAAVAPLVRQHLAPLSPVVRLDTFLAHAEPIDDVGDFLGCWALLADGSALEGEVWAAFEDSGEGWAYSALQLARAMRNSVAPVLSAGARPELAALGRAVSAGLEFDVSRITLEEVEAPDPRARAGGLVCVRCSVYPTDVPPLTAEGLVRPQERLQWAALDAHFVEELNADYARACLPAS